jgi:hypothetical protein
MSYEFYNNEEVIYLTVTGQGDKIGKVFHANAHQWLDNDAEEEFNFYMDASVQMVRHYLNIPYNNYVDVTVEYPQACVLLAAHIKNMHNQIVAISSNDSGTIKSISSNGRSVTFMSSQDIADEIGIPDYIKEMLPKPKGNVKVW